MMKKKILFPILSSLFLLFGSCENNFDAHIRPQKMNMFLI